MKPKPGELVILTEIPRGTLDDLPPEDQQAITDVVGKSILLKDYDDAGRAELEFTDRDGETHYIFVAPKFIRAAQSGCTCPCHRGGVAVHVVPCCDAMPVALVRMRKQSRKRARNSKKKPLKS
jgi:hypothetical protein